MHRIQVYIHTSAQEINPRGIDCQQPNTQSARASLHTVVVGGTASYFHYNDAGPPSTQTRPRLAQRRGRGPSRRNQGRSQLSCGAHLLPCAGIIARRQKRPSKRPKAVQRVCRKRAHALKRLDVAFNIAVLKLCSRGMPVLGKFAKRMATHSVPDARALRVKGQPSARRVHAAPLNDTSLTWWPYMQSSMSQSCPFVQGLWRARTATALISSAVGLYRWSNMHMSPFRQDLRRK